MKNNRKQRKINEIRELNNCRLNKFIYLNYPVSNELIENFGGIQSVIKFFYPRLSKKVHKKYEFMLLDFKTIETQEDYSHNKKTVKTVFSVNKK